MFEELQQSKRAQAANLKKLKANSIKTPSKNDSQKNIDENDVPNRSQVDGEKKSSVKVGQKNASKKKPSTKENAKKFLDVFGSAKRLKIKEKAVLSGVFSKYGSKTALASKDN
ncbi:unnamed protein product [Vicia faba]|uniref:Uncharacterized protein n=1 Tax=Vicia faba TaxID=3906 RepID=A0AAV0YSZ2_VICFA|nr:unnamed protein product [Vicia faba]